MQANDSSPPSGVVELREDVPLKGASGGGACAGPRLISGCFAALSAAVAVALLTQIYYGDYQVVPHGAAATGAEACSEAGARALKDGGRAADAAAAAALCLALLAPHRTSLDASGALLYWEYRSARAQGPQLAEWGGAEPRAEGGPPRLLAALAALHAERGALPWRRVLQPAIDLARSGFTVSKGLAVAVAAAGAGAGADWAAGAPRSDPAFADYLEALQLNSSAELSSVWSKGDAGPLRWRTVPAAAAGRWSLYAGGAGAAAAARALRAALAPPPEDADDAERRVVNALVAEALADASWPPGGVAAGLAVVDPVDTYLALVTGLSMPFGSLPPWGESGAAGARDQSAAPLDLAPAILVDDEVCGTRYVLGAESSGALAQAAAALAAGAAPAAGDVERARVAVLARGALAAEGAAPRALPNASLAAAAPPFAAVNVVQQRGDALASHADSRGGGLASRF